MLMLSWMPSSRTLQEYKFHHPSDCVCLLSNTVPSARDTTVSLSVTRGYTFDSCVSVGCTPVLGYSLGLLIFFFTTGLQSFRRLYKWRLLISHRHDLSNTASSQPSPLSACYWVG
ncbi:hypothetical protein P154DRAFT_204636 [Amniculicola lignicola CBS 123094]|uniref:Uncharacterized protein n=1 Tax=Amniculicola lignicola CBS 123094 TaxID=1392246 RepID=A0A6A5WME7_9PLEO|nr:hypothetical protein P154DRAFT_204636 [Amniculicola lignicola CBS 123094]